MAAATSLPWTVTIDSSLELDELDAPTKSTSPAPFPDFMNISPRIIYAPFTGLGTILRASQRHPGQQEWATQQVLVLSMLYSSL